MDSALALFCRIQLPVVAEHINSRNVKRAVRPHGLSKGCCLGFQRGFLHHVASKCNAMFLAPASDLICKGAGKPLCNVVMIFIPRHRNLSIRQFPEQFRQRVQQTVAISLSKSLFQIIRIRNGHILFLFCKIQTLFMGKLWFIRKNRRNMIPELFSQKSCIRFVGYFDKFFYCLWIQCI